MQIIKLIKEYSLDEYFSILLTKNKSNHLPYHNLYHGLSVMRNSYYIDILDFKSDQKYLRELLLAALFHDFNHSGGKSSDKENVLGSIDQFLKYSKESEEANYRIINIIKATQFPYVIDDKDLNYHQKIIRDADMLQACEDNYLQQVILGLSKEFNADLKTFCENQIKFLNNLVLYTDAANKIWNKNKERLFSEINFIHSII